MQYRVDITFDFEKVQRTYNEGLVHDFSELGAREIKKLEKDGYISKVSSRKSSQGDEVEVDDEDYSA